MRPCVVLDLETTGLPNNGDGFCGRIVEVGAVVVTSDARVVSPISFLVRQPEPHLRSHQARRALRVHKIPAERILEHGLEPDRAAPRLERWLMRVRDRFGVQEVRAYNQGFDFWFLERSPWDLFERTGLQRGIDIQISARRGMGCRSGPKLQKAVDFANRAGADLPWNSAAHRAGEDARMAARIAIWFDTPEAGQPG